MKELIEMFVLSFAQNIASLVGRRFRLPAIFLTVFITVCLSCFLFIIFNLGWIKTFQKLSEPDALSIPGFGVFLGIVAVFVVYINTEPTWDVFMNNLLEIGFEKSISEDGSTITLKKGEKIYIARDFSESGAPTIEYIKNGVVQWGNVRLSENKK